MDHSPAMAAAAAATTAAAAPVPAAATQDQPEIVRELANMVTKYTNTSKLGEEYVSIVALSKWLCDHRHEFNKLESLGQHDQPVPLVTRISAGQQVRMCCLSLHLGFHRHPGLIKQFLHFGNDDHLYAHVGKLASYLIDYEPKRAEQLAAAVYQHYLKFYPVIFQLDAMSVWDEDNALPILDMVPKGEGGTARIHRILVREEFVHHELQKAVPKACVYEPGEGKVRSAFTYSSVRYLLECVRI